MVLRLNIHFMNVLYACNMKSNPAAVSFSAILSCDILDLGQQLSVCVNGISESKVTE